MSYRPWGPLEWALSLSSQKQWHFVGTLGTEVRSLCSWTLLRQGGLLKSEQFAEVRDVESEKYKDRTDILLQARRIEFANCGGSVNSVEKMELMAELFRINAFATRAREAGQSVVLDITSFPKRFFFPILRMLASSPKVQDLLLTYTSAESYAPDNEPLYEDIEPWRILPGFDGSAESGRMWVVSVGFLVESLRRYVGDNPNHQMKLLIPFPGQLSALRRMWEAISRLEQSNPDDRFEKFRVETLDMSAAFDRIRSLAGQHEKPLAFAPFGPKPTSAAMCLYAIQKESSVHYPQPTVYNPDYSQGIRNNNPSEAVTAYWVKHDGENLYAI